MAQDILGYKSFEGRKVGRKEGNFLFASAGADGLE